MAKTDPDAFWKDQGLAAPARRALVGAGIHSLADLAKHTQPQVMELHGMGPNAMTILKTALEQAKLKFRAS